MPIDGCAPHIVGFLSQRVHGEVKNSWETLCGLDVSRMASSSTRTTSSRTSRWTSFISGSPTATSFIEVVISSFRLVIHGHPWRLQCLVGPRMEEEERGLGERLVHTNTHPRTRPRQTQTDTDRPRQTQTDTHRQADRPTDQQTDRHRHKHTHTQAHTGTDTDTDTGTSVVSHRSIHRYHSEGLGGSAAEGTPRERQSQEQAIDVQMADLQSDQQPQFELVVYQAALQVVRTTRPTMPDTPDGVETGQPTQIDMATPRAGQAESARQFRSPGSHSSGHLDRGAAVGVGAVTASDAKHPAPAAGSEAKEMHHSQEAAATPHALPPLVGEAA